MKFERIEAITSARRNFPQLEPAPVTAAIWFQLCLKERA